MSNTDSNGGECLLEAWCRDRGIRPRIILEAARRGMFPAVHRISQRAHLVSIQAIEAWRASSAVGLRPSGLAAAVDDRPAEPFATRENDAGAARATTPTRRRRSAANAGGRVSSPRRRGKSAARG